MPTDRDRVRMTEMELAELFGVLVPTIRAAISALYKSGIVREFETKRCIRLPNGNGTGLSFYEKTLIPVFADVRFLITKPRKFTPLLECRVGYSFAPSDEADGGFYLNPVVGIRYVVGHGHGIFVAVGYELQNLERLKTYGNHFLQAEFAERLRHRSIGIEVGFEF